MNRKLVTQMLVLVLSMTTTRAYADNTKPTCQTVLESCDQVVKLQQVQIQTRDNALADYAVMSKKEADDLAEANRKIDAWYRNPWVWAAVGLGAGLYLGKK